MEVGRETCAAKWGWGNEGLIKTMFEILQVSSRSPPPPNTAPSNLPCRYLDGHGAHLGNNLLGAADWAAVAAFHHSALPLARPTDGGALLDEPCGGGATAGGIPGGQSAETGRFLDPFLLWGTPNHFS